jgi:predicted dehydrogenase
MIKIGVIGYGYWGPNIVRNFSSLEGAEVQTVCDMNLQSLNRVRKVYPNIHTTQDCGDILNSPSIDAVAVITPVSTHYELAKRALLNGNMYLSRNPLQPRSPRPRN